MTRLQAGGVFAPGTPLPDHIIDLGLGYPDLATFPTDLLNLCVLDRSPALLTRALSYGPPGGEPDLVDAAFESVLSDEARIGSTLVTNGSMEAIDLVLRAVAERGQVLVSEDPTFPGLLPAAAAVGLDVVGVESDFDGINPDALQAALRGLRADGRDIAGLYLMPTAANPTGCCSSEERRRIVTDLAVENDLLVIEDDAYRAITFIDPPRSLHTMCPARVVHIRSFSKVLCPGFRLAITVGPPDVIERMTALKPVGGTAPFTSPLVADLLRRLDYPQHLARLREVYGERRDKALAAVRRVMPDAEVAEPAGGFFLWVTLPTDLPANIAYETALQRGVRFLPASAFTIDRSPESTVRIAYSFEPLDRIVEGISMVAEVVAAG